MPTLQSDNPEQAGNVYNGPMYQSPEPVSEGAYPPCGAEYQNAADTGYTAPEQPAPWENGIPNEQPGPAGNALYGAPGMIPPPPPAFQPQPVRFAGFFTRVAAFLVDTIACGVIASTVTSPLLFIDFFAGSIFSRNILFNYSLISILSYLITVTYFTVFTYFWDATPGKKLLNIKVITVDSEGRGGRFVDLLFRESIGRFLSSLLFVGYIAGGLDREKRCFHDMLSDTRVVYDFG